MVYEAARVLPMKRDTDRYALLRLGGGQEVPKRAEQLALIGRQRHLRDGDAQGATRLFTEAIRLAPTFVRPHEHLARIAWDNGDREGALAWLRRALAADPSSWWSLRDLGRKLEALERYAEAEVPLRKLTTLLGDDTGARLVLARVLYAQHKYDEYATHTRVALVQAQRASFPIPEAQAFFEKYERWGPSAALPPAPEVPLPNGWNND
jgi:Flp pilus assembly protein TadD